MLSPPEPRITVKIAAREVAVTSAERSPQTVPACRLSPTTIATPASAAKIAAQVAGATRSFKNIRDMRAANSGEAARMTSTLATAVFSTPTTKDIALIA